MLTVAAEAQEEQFWTVVARRDRRAKAGSTVGVKEGETTDVASGSGDGAAGDGGVSAAGSGRKGAGAAAKDGASRKERATGKDSRPVDGSVRDDGKSASARKDAAAGVPSGSLSKAQSATRVGSKASSLSAAPAAEPCECALVAEAGTLPACAPPAPAGSVESHIGARMPVALDERSDAAAILPAESAAAGGSLSESAVASPSKAALTVPLGTVRGRARAEQRAVSAKSAAGERKEGPKMPAASVGWGASAVCLDNAAAPSVANAASTTAAGKVSIDAAAAVATKEVVSKAPAPATVRVAAATAPLASAPAADTQGEATPTVAGDPAVAGPPGKKKTICRFFASGACRNGNACLFRHELTKRAKHEVEAAKAAPAEARTGASTEAKPEGVTSVRTSAQQPVRAGGPSAVPVAPSAEAAGATRLGVAAASGTRRPAKVAGAGAFGLLANEAAALLQRVARGLLCRVRMRRQRAAWRLQREADETIRMLALQAAAAAIMQRWWRGCLGRRLSCAYQRAMRCGTPSSSSTSSATVTPILLAHPSELDDEYSTTDADGCAAAPTGVHRQRMAITNDADDAPTPPKARRPVAAATIDDCGGGGEGALHAPQRGSSQAEGAASAMSEGRGATGGATGGSGRAAAPTSKTKRKALKAEASAKAKAAQESNAVAQATAAEPVRRRGVAAKGAPADSAPLLVAAQTESAAPVAVAVSYSQPWLQPSGKEGMILAMRTFLHERWLAACRRHGYVSAG